jgi:hypothetical protein
MPCDKHAICLKMGPAKHQCVCDNGYEGNGKTCKEVDGCMSNPCDPNAKCIKTGPATYRCPCNEGYQPQGDQCLLTDACLSRPCSDHSTCETIAPGKYECKCMFGYTADGPDCLEINACHSNPCHSNARCLPSGPGSFNCYCHPGFKGNGLVCTVLFNASDAETDAMRIAGSRAIIKEVRKFKHAEAVEKLAEVDQEQAERIQATEERIANLLRKKRIDDDREEKEKVGTLEQRVDEVAKIATRINEEKSQEIQLIKQLQQQAKQESTDLVAKVESTSKHVANLMANEDQRLEIAHTQNPPEGQPLPSEVSAAEAAKLEANRQMGGDNHLIQPDIHPVHSLEGPLVVEAVQAVAVPVLATAVVAEPNFVRPEIRN